MDELKEEMLASEFLANTAVLEREPPVRDGEREEEFDVVRERASPPFHASAGAAALVVESDPGLARICVRLLRRLQVRARVVWSREEALDLLSRGEERFVFAYLDAGSDDVVAEARRLRPSLPLVRATDAIEEVLTSEGIVLCKPFTAQQFEDAFDAAVEGV